MLRALGRSRILSLPPAFGTVTIAERQAGKSIGDCCRREHRGAVANSPADMGAVDALAGSKKGAPTERLKLSNYLGILRDEPEDDSAYEALKALVEKRDVARLGEQPLRLLEAARQAHEAKGEMSAVARLIEVEALLIDDDPAFATSLWKELGRLRADELLDAEGAQNAYAKALQLTPEDGEALEGRKRLEQDEKSWRKFTKRFVDEAAGAGDVALKTSLLLRAASLVWQYRKKGRDDEADELFRAAREADPGSRRAVLLYEHTLRLRKSWGPLSELLLEAADQARDKTDQASFFTRAGRVFMRRINDETRAAACYERVLDLEPSNAEAMAFLSEHYTKHQRWDDLVAMYSQALSVRHKLEVEQGMLLQIGMIHWRMRERPKDAEHYFARLRKLNPGHPAILDFYREYFAAPEDAEAWVSVVADAQRVASDDRQKLELALLLARAAQAQPQLKDRAIEAWKLVQRLDPGNRAALSELKSLYLRAEKWNALADVIKAEIEATPDEQVKEKVALLRELLAIYRDRLHMDGMVISTLGRIVKLTPGDRDALSELGTKYESAGRYNDLINVLTERADALTDQSEKVDAYLRVALLWIERFANYSQATAPLEKVLQLDPVNREALSQLKDIYEKKRAWKQLFEVLRKEKSVASDPSVRLANTVEMAKLAADRLQGYAEAIALWKEVLELDPRAPGAVEALEKLAEGEKDYDTLVQVLETELGQAQSDEVRIRILQKLALLQGERLGKADDATLCWRRILEIEPKHGRALRAVRDALLKARDWDGLTALYAGVRDFEGLVDVLSHEADDAQDAKLKIDLSFRAARVIEHEIRDASRAARSYERVLAVDPGNAQAATALAAIYERDSKWTRLRAMLDVLLQAATDEAQRLALLGRLRELCLSTLRDGEAAFRYASRAYRLAPQSAEVRASLESAAEAAVAFERLLELYGERLGKAEAAEVALLRRRIATIALERLGQNAVAVEQLRKLLETEPKATEIAAQLERIYRAEQRTSDLRGLLLHRLEHTDDPSVRWQTLKELAQIEEEQLGDPKAAAVHYRTMSEIDQTDRTVLAARDRLAVAAEAWNELAEVLEQRLALEQEPPGSIELGTRLGLLLLDRLDQPERALTVFERVLEQDPIHGPTVVAIERLAEQHDGLAGRAGRVLERAYEQAGRYDKLLKVLGRRLEHEKQEDEVRRLRLRVAEISGQKLGDSMGAYGSLEAAFFEQPQDRELWDRLAEAAERAGQQRALAGAYATALEAGDLGEEERLELAVRAARLHDEVLGQPEEAEPFHLRILRADALNEASFLALKELYTVGERWEELQALYRKRIADSVDADSKLDLLLQLCFVFEEILDRPEQAIESYQQVLQLAPDHGAARRTLEGLYERTERWRELAELLRGNLDQATGQERVDLMLRLGELYETRLSEPGLAVDQYEGVLEEQPHQLRAQQALSRLLAVDAQRQRVAGILEPLYEKQGAYRDLARVLEIRLEDGERDRSAAADLLMRIGELAEHRTRDMEAAFSAYARAVEAEPSHEAARQALARVSDGRDAFRRQRAQVLQRALDGVKDAPALQAELLLELAVLFDQFLGDKDAAERAYERLIEIDPSNTDAVLVAVRALETIHLAKGDFPHLAKDLERQVELETDPGLRGALLVRLGDLCENTLDALDGAIAAHKKRLEIDPAEVDALRALERLYQRTERWTDLVDTLRAHADLSTDDQERRVLGRRVASLRDERLDDVAGAIAAYDEVLETLGMDRETLQALAALYERTERYAELLQTLQNEEALTDDPAQRSVLQLRMAELMRLHTGDVERALEYYDAVLSFSPGDAASLAALEAVMNDASSKFRLDAARLVAPRYEASGSFERLLTVLEVMQDKGDEVDKLAALKRAAEVSDLGLRDSSRAFGYMARAVRVAAADPALRELLAELDRLVEASGRFADYVALLGEIAAEVYDGELRPAVHRRIAQTARARLDDPRLALLHYTKLLEDLPEDQEALDALEALNEASGDHGALIAVLKRKTELARDAGQRRRLLARQAEIYEQRLEQPEQAIEVLQELVLESPSELAYGALERLFTASERWEDLRSVYEQELDRQLGSAVELRYKLARTCHSRLKDTEGALRHLRDALTDDPGHEQSIGLLEEIMAVQGEPRAAAAEILEPIYLNRLQWPKLTAALEARIESEQDVDERKRLLTRLGQIFEDQLEDFDAAIDIYARLFREDPRDEDAWETLSRLAKVGGQWNRLGKILSKPLDDEAQLDDSLARLAKYAGRIYVERASNHHRAAQLFEKALAFDPSDREAFSALEAAYRQTASHEKLLTLYREQVDREDSDERRVKLLHERARIFREVLEQRAEAVATYREILEIEPDDREATLGLELLLTQAEDWPALCDQFRTRIDRAVGTGEEIPLKLKLAELLEQKLSDPAAAIDVYEEIARADAKEQRAMWALERLVQQPEHTLPITRILEPIYRKLDQWKKLVAILEAQVQLLQDEVERVRVLSEIGELHERRGRDAALALHAWMRAFTTDPGNEQARAHVDRLAADMEAWNELVQAYETALTKTEDPVLVASLLTMMGRVHDEKRGDPRGAIAVYERLAKHEPDDPAPLDSLESLHTMVGDWQGLTSVLGRKVEQAYNAQERGELLRRMGSVCEELLADRGAAIDAYKRAVAEDDSDDLAYEALDRLYGLEHKPEELTHVLSRRIELATTPADRVGHGLRMAAVLDRQLHQPDQAIAAYQRVLEDEPAQRSALTTVAALFERQGLWHELLENLGQQERLAESASERARILQRAGEILEQRLGDTEQAIERYREVLEVDPAHAASIDALIRITRLPEHRARAAEIVEPLLRTHARFEDLVQLIEGGLSSLDDAFSRRAELQRLAELHEHGRGKADAAFDTLCRALAEDPGDETVLAELERLARQLGAFEKLAEVLGQRATATVDGTQAASLYRRLARICEDELRDDARAIDAYVKASEQDETRETLLALDRLYARCERWDGLLDVLERRIAATAEPAERIDLLIRLGDLRNERFNDGRGAFVAFKEVLDGDPGEERALAGMERVGRHDALAHDVLDVLDECYRQVGAIDKLAGLYDIRIRLAETDGERLRLLREAARIWESELGNPARALQSMRRAFELDPRQEETLLETERLAQAAGTWEGMRGMVEGLVQSGALEGPRKKELALRAADWYRDKLPDPAAEERCLRWALEVDAAAMGLHDRLIALLRVPGREADLVGAIRASADSEPELEVRKARLREAAQISEGAQGDVARAASCYEALLDVAPDDREALSELARLRAAEGRFADVVALLVRRLALEVERDARTALRVRIAEVQERELAKPADAIESYRGVLREERASVQALAALERLYESTERWEDLRGLLEQQRDGAPDAEAKTTLGLRIAKLAEERLGDREGAVRELLAVVALRPDHEQAQDELERLYGASESWAELVELLMSRAARAVEQGQPERELARLRLAAGVYEQKLRKPDEAVATYARIHARDSRDREALLALERLLMAQERWREAATAMRDLLGLLEGDAARELGLRLAELADQRLADFALAEQALLVAQGASPEHAPTRQRLRALYEAHAAHDKLVHLLVEEEKRTQDATDKLALLNRIAGLYRHELSDPQSAVAYLEQAVALAPGDREALLQLCDLYVAANKARDAIPVLEKIIESYGGRRAKEVALYQHRLGQAYEGLGDIEAALKHFDAAFKIDLTSVPILRDLGRLCLAKGDLERAQKTYRALLLQKLGPDSGIGKADVYCRLGEISSKQGDKVKAKAMLERAIAEAGEHAEARALLDGLG
jgi:tetratricopeptide (TPR) repeat protein